MDITEINQCREKLSSAIANHRSRSWCAKLWVRFIKTRDLFRCVCCDTTEDLEAHHIIRKALFPSAGLETGNGITLCRQCHKKVHAEFNRRPDPSLPIGATQGDDQDEWEFLFGLLYEDATLRGLDQDLFYYLGDETIGFFHDLQGYEELHCAAACGEMTRIRYAHEVWRWMPEIWYTKLAESILISIL